MKKSRKRNKDEASSSCLLKLEKSRSS